MRFIVQTIQIQKYLSAYIFNFDFVWFLSVHQVVIFWDSKIVNVLSTTLLLYPTIAIFMPYR